MTVDPFSVSPSLGIYVLKNGKIDESALEKVAAGILTQDAKLIEEAKTLLAEGLSGNSLWENIGETLEITTPKPVTEEKFSIPFADIFGIEEDLKIDLNKLDENGWYDIFPKDEYEYNIVNEEDTHSINILSKDKNTSLVITPGNETFYSDISYTIQNGETEYYNEIIFDQEGTVMRYVQREIKNDGTISTKRYSFSDNSFVSYEHTRYFGDDESTEYKEYLNGEEMYAETDEVVSLNKYADIVVTAFEDKNFWGKTNKDKITQTVFDTITPENVNKVLSGYAEQTGKNLMQELKANHMDEAYEAIYDKFCFKTLMDKYSVSYSEYKWLEEDIAKALEAGDTKRLDCDFTLVREWHEWCNYYLLESFRKKSQKPQDNISPAEIAEQLGDNYIAPLSDEYLENGVKPALGLIDMINSSNIPEKSKAAYIASLLHNINFDTDKQYLTEMLNLNLSPIYNDSQDNRYLNDILSEMEKYREQLNPFAESIYTGSDNETDIPWSVYRENKDTLNKYYMALKRLSGRYYGYYSVYNNSKEKMHSPNGEFDKIIKQGKTGDCWLVAGTIAMINHDNNAGENGKKILSDLISVNENGDYTVTFKGVDKQYTIPKENVDLYKHLSTGDADMRILELAVEQYIYENTDPNDFSLEFIDLNGNLMTYIWNLILGNGKVEKYEEEKFDFNDPNKVYGFSCSMHTSPNKLYKIGEYADSIFHSKVNIHSGHAYTIVGSDDKYVYVINPWDSSEKIRIELDKFKEINPWINYAEVK